MPFQQVVNNVQAARNAGGFRRVYPHPRTARSGFKQVKPRAAGWRIVRSSLGPPPVIPNYNPAITGPPPGTDFSAVNQLMATIAAHAAAAQNAPDPAIASAIQAQQAQNAARLASVQANPTMGLPSGMDTSGIDEYLRNALAAAAAKRSTPYRM